MRFLNALCIILIVGCPFVGHAEPTHRFIETRSTGSIDWTQGLVRAKGGFGFGPPVLDEAFGDDYAVMQARRNAVKNIRLTLEMVRMDADNTAFNMMAANEMVCARVEEMVAAAPVVDEVVSLDGTVEVTVELALLGSFAQLMLPEDIKQVESVRSFPHPFAEVGTREAVFSENGSIFDDPSVFSGLIVDARGLDARPAMAPMIVDEGGKAVYGSPFVSREYAVQHGVCTYVRNLDDPTANIRVAPKPLWVKGLRTLQGRSSDIVISNADAARLRGASENLSFLRQCRVIIILD